MTAPTASGAFPHTARDAFAVYFDRGVRTVPVPHRSKNPGALNDAWQDLRITPDDRDDYFPEGRALNIGALLGEVSGNLADVDLDCDEAVRAARVLLPTTGWRFGRNGRRGSHYEYRVVGDSKTATFSDGKTKVVELRYSGHTVYPPSRHEGTGEPIEWEEFTDPAKGSAPGLLTAVKKVAAATVLARHWPIKGSRHDAAMALSGGLTRADWAVEDVQQFMIAVAEAAQDDELRDRVRTVESTAERLAEGGTATGWPTLAEIVGDAVVTRVTAWLSISGNSSTASGADPAPWGEPIGVELPPAVPFPLHTLPGPMREYAAQTAAAMPCPPDLPALIALAAAAQAVGRTHALRVRTDWFEGGRLWAAVVLPPSAKKSPAFRAMMRSVYHAQARMVRDSDLLREGYEADLAVYEADLAQYKKARAAAVKAGDDPPDPPRKPKPPPVRQLFTADTTREAFTDLLFDNPRGVGLFRDELSGFALSLNQYRAGGRGDDRQFWLSLWSGEACPTNRKGKRTWLPDPFACVCGCIQPDVLPKLQPESGVEDGFVPRFLFAWPDPVKPVWTGLEPHPDAVAAYEALFDTLLALPLHTDEAGEAEPAVLHLTPDALRRFAAFVDELAEDLGGDELPDNLKPAWGKYQGYTARLALVLSVCRMACGEADAAAPAVDLASVEAAITLVGYFQAHARRVYLRLGSAAAVAGERDVSRVLDWIGRNRDRWVGRTPPHFTWREAFHDLQKSFWDRPDDLQAALHTLEDRGHIREITPDPKGRGRRPKGSYEIHPETGAQNAQNARNGPTQPGAGGGSPSSGHFGHFAHHSGEGNRDAEGGGTAPPDGDGLGARRHPPPPDDTPGAADKTAESTQNGEVSSVSSYVTHESEGQGNGYVSAAGPVGGSSSGGEVSSDDYSDLERFNDTFRPWSPPRPSGSPKSPVCGQTVAGPGSEKSEINSTAAGPAHVLVTDPADLAMVTTAVGESAAVGVDTETTGLDPRTDRVRLLSLCCDATDGGTVTYLIDAVAVPDLTPLWPALASVPVAGHNLVFDLGFLGELDFGPRACRDTMLMSQVLHAGDRAAKHSLAACCLREWGETVAKDEQTADWSGNLTDAQLRYAAADAVLARRLDDAMVPKLAEAGLTEAVTIENRALPAVAWMAGAGVGFDRAAWNSVAAVAAAEAERLAGALDQAAPPRPQGELFGSGWKWDSPKDVAAALEAAGHPVEGTDDDTLAAIDHPLAGLLRDYRAAKKRVTTYGPGWVKDAYRDGRLYPGWRQLGASSGRMSCARPNVQNLPRDARYRKCFVAPPGRVLVKADYSQIELRIAAKIAGDEAMMAAYARGDDLHALTARTVLGKSDVDKADRQVAKSINFGLLYGMGYRNFRVYARSHYGVALTEDQARQYREAFFRAYPGLRRWHAKAGGTRDRAVDTRTLAGRRRAGVKRFTEKLNTPVQGTGSDGLKAALALLWDRRAECHGAVPVLAVHDEVVIECDVGQAGAAAAWLKRAMLDGMAPLAAPVPVAVEVSVAPTWGG